MRTCLTLLLFSLLCTCVRAQNNSSATMVVAINPDVVLLHISSAEGYEEIGYISPELYRLQRQDYPGFRVLPRRSEYDLTIVHRHLDSLAARGWQLESSNFETTLGDSEYQLLDRQRIYYHFTTPPLQLPRVQNPGEYTLLREATVIEPARGHLRGRILKMNDGPMVLVIEERFGNNWRELYRLDGEGAIAGDQASRIKNFTLSHNTLILNYELANGSYFYQFQFDGINYTLERVNFEAADPCGPYKYRLSVGPSSSRVQVFQRGTECNGTEQPRSVTRTVEVAPVYLRSFFAGSYPLEVEKPRLSLLY